MSRVLLFVAAVLTILAVIVILAATSRKAGAAECLHSASEVRKASPGSWPTWSEQTSGHRGERCWFARDGGRPARLRVAARPLRVVGRAIVPLPPTLRSFAPPQEENWEWRPLTLFEEVFIYFGHLPRGAQ